MSWSAYRQKQEFWKSAIENYVDVMDQWRPGLCPNCLSVISIKGKTEDKTAVWKSTSHSEDKSTASGMSAPDFMAQEFDVVSFSPIEPQTLFCLSNLLILWVNCNYLIFFGGGVCHLS